MIGADRLTAHFAERMNAEWRAGRRGEDVLLDAHGAYGQNCAEVVFLHATDPLFHLNAAENTAKAAAAQMATVAAVNRYFYGDDRDPAFDDRCRVAVARNFWTRLADLRLGMEVCR